MAITAVPGIFIRFAFPLFFLFLVSCGSSDKDVITVDFSKIIKDTAQLEVADSANPLRVAVAAIISPSESFIYYRELFDYISKKINKSVVFEQRKTYLEINELLVNRKVDIAFICSGTYLPNREYCELLVVPVCNGLPYYQAYIIVNANSPAHSFDDLKGKTFAFSDPLSNTGRLYPDFRVKKFYSTYPEKFFAKTLYTFAHDISIQLVSKNVVDGASVDGLIYEYLRKNTPAKVENVKIIEKSEYFGIPPVVNSIWIDADLKTKLKELFLTIHKDSAGSRILEKLMIDKFTVTTDTLYESISQMNSFMKQ